MKPDEDYHCEQVENSKISFHLYTDENLAQIFPTPMCYAAPHKNAGGDQGT